MILFTADWHLKLGQKNVPVCWSKDRYYDFFTQVHKLEEQCSLHIIGGDLFDRIPSMAELELYFDFISGVSIPTIIYDGNHEATRKNQTFFSALERATKSINPLVSIITETTVYEGFSILPYCDLHKKGVIDGLPKDRPLFTHVRGEIPPHVKPEVDLGLFKEFPVVYAGDLHSHSNTQLNIVYPGSPMTTSFHRNLVETGYLLLDGEQWQWGAFKLPQLIRKTVSSPDDMIPSDYHHTIYELEGDIQELAAVKNTELLDKKLIKRSSEATLIMDDSFTMQEELSQYLSKIMSIPQNQIDSIIGTFNDYSKNLDLE